MTIDSNSISSAADAPKPFAIHLLDVGEEEYGDCVLCQFGDVSVLIDGSHTGDQKPSGDHPSIPDQIGKILKQKQTPFRLSLLIVSHAHEDHIGCLPYLIKNRLLTFDWALVADPDLGWGRSPNGSRDDIVSDERVRQVVAGLREEIRTARTDDHTLGEFLADAVTLEQRYGQMLATLREEGTHVVGHGRDDPGPLVEALQAEGVRLKIIGPSRPQLAICAERIAKATQSARDTISGLFKRDAALSPADMYRQLTGGASDELDAKSRPGPAVNLQSLLTSFEYRGKKFLFTGDSQLADPEIGGLNEYVAELREEISKDAPYDFVKLAHHGSANAFSEEMLAELGGTQFFGICAGEKSSDHPSPEVLDLLHKNRSKLKWARTDRNRQVTFFFGENGPRYKINRGKINEPAYNSADEPRPAPAPQPAPAPPPAPLPAPSPVNTQVTAAPPPPAAPPPAATPADSMVEVITRVPHVSTRVTITIDVEPRAGTPAPAAPNHPDAPRPAALPPLHVAHGRELPPLLFVTSRQVLEANIGESECAHLLQALRARNLLLYDELPANATESSQVAPIVRDLLRRHPAVEGVVIIGGYDVVPAQRLDCLPASLRSQVDGYEEADNFIVWSDDIYGDRDGDMLPELPVSRIPDGKSKHTVFAAIQAGRTPGGWGRIGVRNVKRRFADLVFDRMPGDGAMFVSKPTIFDQENPRIALDAERIYIMLHGDYTDCGRFWGEGVNGNREAVNLANIPQQRGSIVFAGCCWGALTVKTPAGRVANGRPFGVITPEDSIALTFLSRGALAFVGCTGAHYSPLEEPYQYFGGPMHEAFWRICDSGRSPARSLFEAKLQYLRGMPHGQTGAAAQAIEYKILRQYTCLGLGW